MIESHADKSVFEAFETNTERITTEGLPQIVRRRRIRRVSLAAVLCVNSVGQVMEQGVMMHRQHHPWVVPPEILADGTRCTS